MRPVFKRVDTCAAEFEARHALHLLDLRDGTLGEDPRTRREPSDRRKVVILGGGPNRIGQGIEFDYCCCQAAFAPRRPTASRSVMVNSNPETV